MTTKKLDTHFAYDASIEITRPPAQVFAAFTHVPAIPKWMKPVRDIRNFTSTKLGVGCTYTQVGIFLSREFSTNVEITGFVPGKRVKYKYEGHITGEMLVTFSDIAGTTLLNLVFKGETDGFFRMPAPLLKANLQKQMQADLQVLKDQLDVKV